MEFAVPLAWRAHISAQTLAAAHCGKRADRDRAHDAYTI